MNRATNNQLAAAFNKAREIADRSGYGQYFSDDLCRQFSAEIAEAVLAIPSHQDQGGGATDA